MNPEFKCEYCKKKHDGSYASGRFCSKECARGFSTKEKRKEINLKVSQTAKEKHIGSKQHLEHLAKIRQKAIETVKNNKKKRLVKVKDQLDITYGELEEYRKAHPVCEICGKPEKFRAYKDKKEPNKLAIDHNHKTNHFRGLLCGDCNRKLGWFENLSGEILRYLQDKDGHVVELVNTSALHAEESEFEPRRDHQ